MRYTKAIPVGLLAVVAVQCLLIPSCSSKPPRYTRSTRAVQSIKQTIASNRELNANGQLLEWAAGDHGRGEPPGPMLPLMFEKLRLVVTKEVSDPSNQAEALGMLDRADVLLHDQLAPAYTKAMKSGRPDDAKALVGFYDELDRRMDELLRILS